MIFYIPKHGMHKFITAGRSSMDVIAYHPDSDWGPTHEDHPMLNRTWVEGEKLDNTLASHQSEALVIGDVRKNKAPQ